MWGVGGNELSCCGLMHVKVYVFDVLIFFLPQNGMVTKDLTRLKTLLAETEVIMSILLVCLFSCVPGDLCLLGTYQFKHYCFHWSVGLYHVALQEPFITVLHDM